jgi:uncharacterized protein (DUF362 family)
MKTSGEAISRNTVIIKRLRADHGKGSFIPYVPLSDEMVAEVKTTVKQVFDSLGGASLIKASGEVYIKPNGVGNQAYAYTRPEVVEAAIEYWFAAGARQVFLLENSTQAALTRLVFELTGYREISERTGAKAICLDEEPTLPFSFAGKGPASERDPKGYEITSFGMPKTVAEKLIEKRDENLYVSIPKLKTHSMAVVTLGIKNQWAFAPHTDRILDHNYNLASKLVDILGHVRPDVTLIEGVEGTIYGHYPPLALADKCVRPFKILIGGLNVVATDIVGAKVFGLEVDEVPHLKLAVKRGLGAGVKSLDDIEVTGDFEEVRHIDILNELQEFGGKYPYNLYPEFPDDVAFVVGKEMACAEGCFAASRSGVQSMYVDYQGKGGFTLVTGKGFDADEIDSLDGPVVVSGGCALKEVGDRLVNRLGRDNVYLIDGCCNLTPISESLCHLTQVEPARMLQGADPGKALEAIVTAMQNGSKGIQLDGLSHLNKKW